MNSAVRYAAKLGEDTDTVGALTGALADAVYGYESISTDDLEQLQNKSLLEEIIEPWLRKYVVWAGQLNNSKREHIDYG